MRLKKEEKETATSAAATAATTKYHMNSDHQKAHLETTAFFCLGYNRPERSTISRTVLGAEPLR